MRLPLHLLVAAGLLLVACRERPLAPAPLPTSFAVRTLSGQRLTPEEMRGVPWVVNFWLPT
jgi:hypothetical protein